MSHWKSLLTALVLTMAVPGLLTGCAGNDGDNGSGGNHGGQNDDSDSLSDFDPEQINDSDGTLSATIRYTTGGVPHILATNLESAGFGSGYAQARANACIIADQIIRVRGERSRFYGPGPATVPGVPATASGANVISDFSMKALGLMRRAENGFADLSPASQAILRGFAAGYNYYLTETANLTNTGRHHKCAGASWVRPITPQELYAYDHLVALFASGMQFATGATFFANPNGSRASLPKPARGTTASVRPWADDGMRLARLDLPIRTDFSTLDIGSNGWGLGGDLTESGRGALLANPHFPYTGNRRLFQMQITVPGVYDVNGAALIGIPIPLIGFNQSIAWTHTVSTANHFTFYRLKLAAGKPEVYIKDGEPQGITARTVRIKVDTGQPQPVTMEKTFYYSEYGPMVNANLINAQLPEWGDAFAGVPSAFTYRDANVDTAGQVIDQWLQMGMADDLDEFKQAFAGCSSVLWVNTMYADADGNAFYIDATSVPNLSAATSRALGGRIAANPYVAALYDNGVVLLDGSTSRDDWVEGDCGTGLIHYPDMPRLTRSDYVQNSNDSFWATNLKTLDAMATAGYSPLFGPVGNALSPRTRMGLKMLSQPTDVGLSRVRPAGADGRFSGRDIIDMLYSNRAYYAELLLDDLLARCAAVGTAPVALRDGSSRPVADGCVALGDWNGVYDSDSVGAAVFRVFIGHYDDKLSDAFTVPFDPDQPATTPRQPSPPGTDLSRDPMLTALAQGLETLDKAAIAYDAKLGDVQFVQQSESVPPGAAAAPAGNPILWPGTANIEGGFNIVEPYFGRVADGTRYPRVTARDSLANTGGLSSLSRGWQIARGTSWHFGLMFTDNGPQAWGLVSYSQSVDSASPHFGDQDERYAAKNYRKLLYSEQEISSDANLKTITIETVDTTT